MEKKVVGIRGGSDKPANFLCAYSNTIWHLFLAGPTVLYLAPVHSVLPLAILPRHATLTADASDARRGASFSTYSQADTPFDLVTFTENFLLINFAGTRSTSVTFAARKGSSDE